jgi:hypothetical protein
MSEHDYSIEDELKKKCPHAETFILWTRYCCDCGDIREEQVLEPGTETITHHVTLAIP